MLWVYVPVLPFVVLGIAGVVKVRFPGFAELRMVFARAMSMVLAMSSNAADGSPSMVVMLASAVACFDSGRVPV